MTEPRECRRCGRQVVASASDYEVFEHMHYVCFHYEFEHEGDPDIECAAGGCPAAGITASSLLFRTEGADVVQEANTVVPAILALQQLGFEIEQHGATFSAKARGSRFAADDPVAVLGLIKLVETRRPWRASDSEIDEVLGEFDL